MRKLYLASVAILCLGLLGSCSAPDAQLAGLIVQFQGLQQVSKVLAQATQNADDATKARTADVTSQLSIHLDELRRLLDAKGKAIEKSAYGLVDKTFTESNDILFGVMQSLQDATVDVDFRVNNLLINALRAYTALPFVRVRPFIAAVHPTYLVPGRDSYQIELIGLLRNELGSPEFTLRDGTKIEPSIGIGNRVVFNLEKDVIKKYQDKRFLVQVSYPVSSRWYWKNERDVRDIWISVLPAKIAQYRVVEATANPDFEYDYPVISIPFNFNAGAGEDLTKQTIMSLQDIARDPRVNADFVNVFDSTQSRIEAVWLEKEGGNNPTGDNVNTVNEGTGGRLVVSHRVHGKPGNMFGGGAAGANVSGLIMVRLKIAHKRAPIHWEIQGAADTGTIEYGQSIVLIPKPTPAEPTKPFESLLLRISDHTFDPPVQRTLNLRQAHRSKFLTVETTPERVTIAARSFPR